MKANELGIALRGDRNQCTGCDEVFNSTSAFEKHRTGKHGVDRRCRSPEEMLAIGMAQGSHGYWVGSPMPSNVLEEITDV